MTSKRIVSLCLALLTSLILSGCFGTHAPKTARSRTASFSAIPDPTGNYATSGVWGWRTNKDLVIDGTGRNTYNTLIFRGYGEGLTPPIEKTNMDYGLRPYTADPVEPLKGLNGEWTKPVKNPGNLWDMNPPAQEAWPTMTRLSRQPKANQKPP